MAAVAGVEEPTCEELDNHRRLQRERRLSADVEREQAIAFQDTEMRVAAELDQEEAAFWEEARKERRQFDKDFHRQAAARKQAARVRHAQVAAAQKEAAAVAAKEAKAIIAKQRRLSLKERSARKQGQMSRTEADVNADEEAELHRLEDGDVEVSTDVL